MDDATISRLSIKGNYYAVLGMFIWVPLCSWILGLVFYGLAQWFDGQFNDTPYRIVPTLPYWCIVAAIFAFAWAHEPMVGTIRFFLGQEGVDAVSIMSERQYGYDGKRVNIAFRNFLVAVGIVAFLFVSDYGIFVYPKQLVFNNLVSLFQKRTVDISNVSSIAYAKGHLNRNKSVTAEPIYILRLKDNTVFKSNFNDLDKVAPVMQYLSSQSGIKVDTIATWE